MSVAIGTCKECKTTKDFTIESVLYRKNNGDRFSYICSSCSGKPACSLCDMDDCALYKCSVCKNKEEKRICEKCNDETNHSEPWKCPTCKNKKSDKSEYVNSCFKLHQHLQSIEKAEEYLKKDKETILRHEKEIERLLTEVSTMRKKMHDVENKLQQREKDTKRYSDDCFVLFKKLKK